ncbi:MAG: ATP-binding cassette domain-containing protein [Planctomycetota bacterium]
MTETPHFATRSVTRTFSSRRGDVHALTDVTVIVPRGEFLVLTGPSGCGKTTLLALLSALDRPTAGDVLHRGEDLGRAPEGVRALVRRRIGLVFQHSHMIRGLPLWENVTYPLVPRGVDERERRAIAESLLERVQMKDCVLALPRELSAGELRRAAVARALVGEPEALFADEPTSNLDAESAEAVISVLRDTHARGATVIAATHDPALATLATARIELSGGTRADAESPR